jgi:hypothetical protein
MEYFHVDGYSSEGKLIGSPLLLPGIFGYSIPNGGKIHCSAETSRRANLASD